MTKPNDRAAVERRAAAMDANEHISFEDKILAYEEAGEMEDAGEAAFERWARSYDDLNGAPENDGDR